eukprot:6190457-Pleurochrysis_carterae.AAC.3
MLLCWHSQASNYSSYKITDTNRPTSLDTGYCDLRMYHQFSPGKECSAKAYQLTQIRQLLFMA